MADRDAGAANAFTDDEIRVRGDADAGPLQEHARHSTGRALACGGVSAPDHRLLA